jgi:hypothetical protein
MINGQMQDCDGAKGYCEHSSVGNLVKGKCPKSCYLCPGQAPCQDTDDGAKDPYGDDCSAYNPSWCGYYDDKDFKSKSMCCVCGGGTR